MKADLTLTISREPFELILKRVKTIEYREMKRFYESRFRQLRPPFALKLRNGYRADSPTIIVRIGSIRCNRKANYYLLAIERILSAKNLKPEQRSLKGIPKKQGGTGHLSLQLRP